MLGITAAPLADGGITLAARDGSLIRIDAPVDGKEVWTSLSRLDSVRRASPEADEWLSHQLRRPVRLGWLDDPRRRTVSVAHGGEPGDHLNLSDAGPLLLTSEASLRQLDVWIEETAAERSETLPTPMSMTRFRPSIVVDLVAEPFAEDAWMRIRIGDVEFRQSERCDRCVLTTIDPAHLAQGKEPLRTLARHRRFARKTWFGIRLIPLTTGTLCVGDALRVERAAGDETQHRDLGKRL